VELLAVVVRVVLTGRSRRRCQSRVLTGRARRRCQSRVLILLTGRARRRCQGWLLLGRAHQGGEPRRVRRGVEGGCPRRARRLLSRTATTPRTIKIVASATVAAALTVDVRLESAEAGAHDVFLGVAEDATAPGSARTCAAAGRGKGSTTAEKTTDTRRGRRKTASTVSSNARSAATCSHLLSTRRDRSIHHQSVIYRC
jgi:hypothetical protein